MQTLSVKNLEKFQHYGNRNPPWIKLYTNILDDYTFSLLTETERYHLILIWLLASRIGNQIPNNPEWVQSRIHSVHPPALHKYIELGFLIVNGKSSLAHDASTMTLAPGDSKPLAPEEKSRVEQRRYPSQIDSPLSEINISTGVKG